jgi:hypothetical protein
MVQPMKSERVTFDHFLQVKSPKALADALDKAASSRLMSRSDFIRRRWLIA